MSEHTVATGRPQTRNACAQTLTRPRGSRCRRRSPGRGIRQGPDRGGGRSDVRSNLRLLNACLVRGPNQDLVLGPARRVCFPSRPPQPDGRWRAEQWPSSFACDSCLPLVCARRGPRPRADDGANTPAQSLADAGDSRLPGWGQSRNWCQKAWRDPPPGLTGALLHAGGAEAVFALRVDVHLVRGRVVQHERRAGVLARGFVPELVADLCKNSTNGTLGTLGNGAPTGGLPHVARGPGLRGVRTRRNALGLSPKQRQAPETTREEYEQLSRPPR